MSSSNTAVEEREDVDDTPSPRSPKTTALIVKIILVGLVDALLIISFAKAASDDWWLAAVFFAVVFLAVNFAYFTNKALPLKYLLPGLVFLVAFQIYTMVFTGYASFTNYGSNHLGAKDEAIASIQAKNVVPVENSPTYPCVPIVKDGTVSMLVTDPDTGVTSIGTSEGLTEVDDADLVKDGDQVTGVNGYETLNLGTMAGNPDYDKQWKDLQVPFDAEAGTYLRAKSITQASLAKAGFVYDADQDAMVSTTDGTVYPADGAKGNFINEAGERLQPGWRVSVGFANYTKLLTDDTLRSRFLPITAWTFFFAIMTTFLNFALGLTMAMVLNERRMRGQGIYRLLLIVPFGIPFILSALVWKAMLNTDFGFINQVLTSDIPWLNDPGLARFSVLMVNLWSGFPYFFLVCSGALTAIPNDLKEAAYVDGASGRYAFRTVILPLLLVATAPLLVTTFAFNFNNYTLIELLTGGGPFPGTLQEGGSTDLLINWTFRQAFGTPQQLGLASAIAMFIFVIVGTVSAYGFRLTRRLEEIGT
jgi:arabinogalactan oligomer / maltooligosaccharide transport system permease protein